MEHRDVVSWTGYVHSGEINLALKLFSQMQEDGLNPDARAYVAALKACSDGFRGNKELVKTALALHIQLGDYESQILAANGNFGKMDDAQRVIDKMKQRDRVSWTAMILGYAKNENSKLALELFKRMQGEGLEPDARTFVAVLKAYSELAANEKGYSKAWCLREGSALHSQISRGGYESDSFVVNGLLEMYIKCVSLEDALKVFKKTEQRNISTWNLMINAYSHSDEADFALELFSKMKEGGLLPDARTYIAVLKACTNLALLQRGRSIHDEVRKAGFEGDESVSTSLVDFYAKCGCMTESEQIFSGMKPKNLAAWNALMAGYALQGNSTKVFTLFEKLQESRLHPDCVTLLSVLNACNHAGLVDKGKEIFEKMSSENLGVAPTLGHYTCMVDLLGRRNYLREALNMVETMPFKADKVIWMTVLAASLKWKNVDVARIAFEALIEIDSTDSAPYVLMGNTYAAVGLWEETQKVKKMRMNCRAWKKTPGRSWWTDDAGNVHKFTVDETNHPQIHEIKFKLAEVIGKIEQDGYSPNLESVHREINDDEKKAALLGHSEKLAVACGLLNSPAGRTLRIIKNLRICEDCHRAMAFISKRENRQVICRDSSRFHVFENGRCSCNDFW